MRFLLLRLGQGMLQLVGVSILAFGLMEIAPGDFWDEAKLSAQISPQAVARWQEEFGANESAVTRYWRWSRSMLRGEFGQSMAYGIPVSELLRGRVWNTLALSLSAMALCWGIAVPLGVYCAAHAGGWADRLAGSVTVLFLSLPDLLAGLLALAVTVRMGIATVEERFLPAAVGLACLGFPAVFRHTMSSMRQVLGMPFLEHLRAFGVTERRIVFVHGLRAAANPLISLLGLSLAGVTSSSLVMEVTLQWPGMGPLLLESILARDVAVVLAAVLLSAGCMLLGNLAADVLLYVADPRIRRDAE